FFGGPGGIALSPDGKQLVVVGRELQNGQVASHVKVWETATGKEVRQIKGPANNLYGQILVSPDGKSLVTGDFNGTIEFWDLEKDQSTKKFVGKKQNRYPSALLFSPDGKTLAAQSGRSVQLWDVDKGKELRELGEQDAALGGIMFAPFGYYG